MSTDPDYKSMRESAWDTPGLIERARALMSSEMSYSRIQVKLNQEFRINLSRNSVIGKAARLGFRRGSGTKGQRRDSAPKAKSEKRAVPPTPQKNRITVRPEKERGELKPQYHELGRKPISLDKFGLPFAARTRTFLSLVDLEARECVFIIDLCGENSARCGMPTAGRQSYCCVHSAVARRPARSYERSLTRVRGP